MHARREATRTPGRPGLVRVDLDGRRETAIGRTWRKPKRARGAGAREGERRTRSRPAAEPRPRRPRAARRTASLSGSASWTRSGAKSSDPRSAAADARDEAVESGVVGRGDVPQRAVVLGVGEARLHQVLGLGDRIVGRRLAHVDGPELRLGLLQQLADGAEGGGACG